MERLQTERIHINNPFKKESSLVRQPLFDQIRGITLISMVLFHAYWDMIYLIGAEPLFHSETAAYIWQQSICWTFIFLSGLCMNLAKNQWGRGMQVFGAGILVTVVTMVVIPEERIVFGVLTFLGSAMLIGGLVRKFCKNAPAHAGLFISTGLFLLTRPINEGYLGILDKCIWKLPEVLYNGYFATYLGFADPEFFSGDYFSLMPWIFLFFAGYFLGRIFNVENRGDKETVSEEKEKKGKGFVYWLGRNSLFVYLIHQPLLYIFVMILRK